MHEEEREGLTCDDCDAFTDAKRRELYSNYRDEWGYLTFGSVPGGASVARPGGGRGYGDTPKEHQKNFDQGLYDFEANRKEGLLTGTNKGATEKAYKKAERNERLKKKYKSGDLDAKGIELGPDIVKQIGA
ncbi:hypothetical protein [Porticoccus sp.]